MWETWVRSLGQEDTMKKGKGTHSQVALVVKNLSANAGDIRDEGLIPGLGRSPGRGNGNPLQCSCLENPMETGAWWATVHRVAKSWTWLKWLSTHTVPVLMKHMLLFSCYSGSNLQKNWTPLGSLMDCSLPGSSVHGISQVRILEWGAIYFSRGSSWPRNQTHNSCIGRWIFFSFFFFNHWATWEALWST